MECPFCNRCYQREHGLQGHIHTVHQKLVNKPPSPSTVNIVNYTVNIAQFFDCEKLIIKELENAQKLGYKGEDLLDYIHDRAENNAQDPAAKLLLDALDPENDHPTKEQLVINDLIADAIEQ